MAFAGFLVVYVHNGRSRQGFWERQNLGFLGMGVCVVVGEEKIIDWERRMGKDLGAWKCREREFTGRVSKEGYGYE